MKNFLSVVLIPCLLGLAIVGNAQEFGLASYYSDDFQGRKTAYGDTYDKDKLTAAHKKHPYGTKLKVTRLDNNKTVEVMVNDKGPYIKGRVIDLSRAAAERLELVGDGVVEVKIEVVGKANVTASKSTKEIPKSAEERVTPKPEVATRTTTSKPAAAAEKKTAATTSDSKTSYPQMPSKKDKEEEKPKRLVGKDYQQFGLYKIVLERPESKGYGVQVASLTNYQNVLRQVADLQAKWFDNILISVERGTVMSPSIRFYWGHFLPMLPHKTTGVAWRKIIRLKVSPLIWMRFLTKRWLRYQKQKKPQWISAAAFLLKATKNHY